MTLAWLRHTVAVWLVDSFGFYLAALVLPSVTVQGVVAVLTVTLWIGVLNATVRLLLLAITVRLPLLLFLAGVVLLNAAVIQIASVMTAGVHVDNLAAAFALSVVVAAVNATVVNFTGLAGGESFYLAVVQRAARRDRDRSTEPTRPGVLLVQIDGLALPILEMALAQGRMKTLRRWLAAGSHRLWPWECDVPSMTASAQAGILYGNNADIPAFRWFDKATGRLIVANHPADAHMLDARLSHGQGLLRDGGSSLANIFTGGARRSVLTMAALAGDHGQMEFRTRDLYPYLANPYNFTRGLARMVWEVVLDRWEAWRQARRNVVPRLGRGGVYPVLRAVTTVLMRDAAVWLAIDDIFSDRTVSYLDLLGYDEVAHHAGPATPDALRVLRGIDHQLRLLERAIRAAPRPWRVVVLSDHGQSPGRTFRQRYGCTLEELVQSLVNGDGRVQMSAGTGEGWGHVNAALTEVVQLETLFGRGMRWLLRGRSRAGAVELGPEAAGRRRVEQADIVVCASGNLAQVYLVREPDRLSLEHLRRRCPGLVDGLVHHPGIGFVVAQSERRGLVALGARGMRELATGVVEGEDPLAPFEPHTAAFLLRMGGFAGAGDLTINSMYDPATGEVAAFEELVGSHGGAGGMQTRAFVAYPAEWTAELPTIVGAEQLHTFLAGHILGAPDSAETSRPA